MNFFGPYLNMWKNYVNFSDRTTVRGYWMAVLVNIIASTILGIIGIKLLISLYSLATFIPGIAMCVRRLRDSGRKWGWIFISLVPLVGWIILIVMLCKASMPEDDVPVV
ncbi:MAG: DUF805 domain-containing protein [Ruminococcaceae bacterium]|nr:DUF805 domain-containing protein [Oscillospiraceae bacterium]